MIHRTGGGVCSNSILMLEIYVSVKDKNKPMEKQQKLYLDKKNGKTTAALASTLTSETGAKFLVCVL